jgi:protein-tyrosine-phosphatase
MIDATPAVLFLCTHNAGRSQMAMGFLQHLAGDRATIYSAGSEPANEVNPAAIAAMAEKGIDIAAAQPRRWNSDDFEAVQVVVTMGCGEECPYIPGKHYENWELNDPAGQDIDTVRRIRDDIERRVKVLAESLGLQPMPPITDLLQPPIRGPR